ncbi:MAG: gfo/Idh/MocA family oxidoreductase, partial [Bacteroidetes bacterium]|nr:gfo/Idh/MocA family oxidoreductase [Bacteroidota bacterium]
SYDCKKTSDSIEIVGYKGTLTIENIFGRKSLTSKLIIDLQGEGKKVFRKRITKYLYIIRSVQKTFIKNEHSVVCAEDALINMKIIEEIENKCLSEKN